MFYKKMISAPSDLSLKQKEARKVESAKARTEHAELLKTLRDNLQLDPKTGEHVTYKTFFSTYFPAHDLTPDLLPKTSTSEVFPARPSQASSDYSRQSKAFHNAEERRRRKELRNIVMHARTVLKLDRTTSKKEVLEAMNQYCNQNRPSKKQKPFNAKAPQGKPIYDDVTQEAWAMALFKMNEASILSKIESIRNLRAELDGWHRQIDIDQQSMIEADNERTSSKEEADGANNIVTEYDKDLHELTNVLSELKFNADQKEEFAWVTLQVALTLRFNKDANIPKKVHSIDYQLSLLEQLDTLETTLKRESEWLATQMAIQQELTVRALNLRNYGFHPLCRVSTR